MKIMAAIDLETTGLDAARCEIIDMAVVPLNEDFTVSDFLSTKALNTEALTGIIVDVLGGTASFNV